MVEDQDWATIYNSSEVFRGFVERSLTAEAKREEEVRLIKEAEVDRFAEVLDQLDIFESNLRQNPGLLNKFRQVKQALLDNPHLIDKIDPNFVSGIMMLDLSDYDLEVSE